MTNNNAIIQTHQLTKQYGQFLALDHVDLTIPKGSIYGLVGNNGGTHPRSSGKSENRSITP